MTPAHETPDEGINALGQAYCEFEHDDDLRIAVLYGKGPDFSRGLDLASWGAALVAGPFRQPPKFLDPLASREALTGVQRPANERRP